MRKKIITSYQHRIGTHCGSTAMRNILNYFGVVLSEEMCFGLGSGIGFAYFLKKDDVIPVFVGGRTDTLETDLLNNLEIENYLCEGDDFEEVFSMLKERIDKDEPVVVWVDTYYMPYFKTPYHFSVHRVIIVGYDDDKKEVYISDNEREEIQVVSYENFRYARTSSGPPLPTKNRWYDIRFKGRIKDKNFAIKDALRKTANIMLDSKTDNFGIEGMRQFVLDLQNWREILGERWKLASHIYYLLCEKFGTGGGSFRFIYSRFLEEANLSDEIVKKYRDIALMWQRANTLIRDASKEDDFSKVISASDILGRIVTQEEYIYRIFSNL